MRRVVVLLFVCAVLAAATSSVCTRTRRSARHCSARTIGYPLVLSLTGVTVAPLHRQFKKAGGL